MYYFFVIPLLYYFNLSLSIISCLSFGYIYIYIYIYLYIHIYTYLYLYIYLSLGIFLIILICYCLLIYLLWIFRNFRNYSSNFITDKLPVASAVFWITLFEKVLSASFLAWLGIYQFTVFTNQHFTYIFTNVFSCIFSKRPKSIAFYKYSISSWNWISSRFTL